LPSTQTPLLLQSIKVGTSQSLIITSQSDPVVSGRQEQEKLEPPRLRQEPPFWQGSVAHGLVPVSQVGPV